MLVNIKRGVAAGAFAGVLLGTVAGVVLALKEDLPRGASPVGIVLSYPAAGVIGGMLVGLMQPLLTSRRNAGLIGAVVGVVLMFLLMPLALGLPTTWDPGEVVGVVVTGVILGFLGGRQWWSILTDGSS